MPRELPRIRLYNTQARAKEDFQPLDPAGVRVRMYCCGPTVYDSLHLGHARASVVPDVLRRYLEYRGYQVRYALNFTDVDDKIIKRAVKEQRDWRELATTYMDEYHQLVLALGNRPADAYPRATDFIPEMQDLVARLLTSKHAYIARDGDIYFDTASFPRYGALSGRGREEEEEGRSERLSAERLGAKKNPGDFVVWKLLKNDQGEIAAGGHAVPRWPSPWGEGRPGWHLECSAMSRHYLGLPFDIHAGGQDLIFPHHEDEKAQSECAYEGELQGREMVRHWVHNAFVSVKARPQDQGLDAGLVSPDGSVKMSKSLGNVKWLREMIWPEGPCDPIALRMLILGSHYRSPIVFEPAMLDEATAKLGRLYEALDGLARAAGLPPGAPAVPAGAAASRRTVPTPVTALGRASAQARDAFAAAMDDDLNTAGALAALFELVNSSNQESSRSGGDAATLLEARATLQELMQVLGLRPVRARQGAAQEAEALVRLLLESRRAARAAKQFQLADQIRNQLLALGYQIKDLPDGSSAATK